MSRENFRSRLGFILVSAGCAIGIGNVWKFPYVTGVNGGSVFVLFYIISLVIMGVPILTMELAVGRASRKSAVLGYKALEPKGSRWHIHGWLCVIGCCLLMMYYTTVSGWMLDYPSAEDYLTPLYSSASADGHGSNDGDYKSPKFDQELADALSQTDESKRTAALQEAQETLLQDLPSIPLWCDNVAAVSAQNVKNVQFDYTNMPTYNTITK